MEQANRLLQRYGFISIGRSEPVALRSILPCLHRANGSVALNHPVVVVGESSHSEFSEQCSVSGKTDFGEWKHYYRVVAE